MPTNPYRPPKSRVADISLSAHPSSVPKPLAITILQVVAYLPIALFSIGVLSSLLSMFGKQPALMQALWGVVWRSSVLAVLVLMQIHIQKRTLTGRRLGLIAIGVLTAPIFNVGLDPTLMEQSVTKSAPLVYGMLSTTFLPLVYWAYAFAFSRKAKRYFQISAKTESKALGGA